MRRVLTLFMFGLLAAAASAQQGLTVCKLNRINKDVEQTIGQAGKRVSVTIPKWSSGRTMSGPDLIPDHQFTFYIFDTSCSPFEDSGQGFLVAWPKDDGIVMFDSRKDPVTGEYHQDTAHPHYSALPVPSTEGGALTVIGVLEADGPKGELVLHMDSYTQCWTGGDPQRTECSKQQVVR